MNTNRRMELLEKFAEAGNKGLTMTEGQFNAVEVSKLEGLIERQAGPRGFYCITEQGTKYLALKQLGQARQEPVAA